MRAAAVALSLAAAPAAALDCSIALVLALDVSSSVDDGEYAMQMRGIADALRDPAIIDTILTPAGSGILATAFAWSGFRHQETLVDWAWLGDEAAILAFAAALEAAPRSYDHWPTALGRAAGYAVERHRAAPARCLRHVVDISGDGANNDGVGPEWHRARGDFDGLTINGLVIRGAEPDPEAYFIENVIHGPGAFVEVIDRYDDYAEAMRRKLLRELQPPFADLR